MRRRTCEYPLQQLSPARVCAWRTSNDMPLTPIPSSSVGASPARSIFEKLGARVVVDGSSLALLDGATVDFKDEMAKSAFIVSANPMSDASCGCGTSFTAKEVL